MEIISLEDALKVMEEGPCTITVISCDMNRNRGGKRIVYKDATLTTTTGKNHKYFNHRNNTRTINVPGLSYPESFHPILMTHINGKEVSL